MQMLSQSNLVARPSMFILSLFPLFMTMIPPAASTTAAVVHLPPSQATRLPLLLPYPVLLALLPLPLRLRESHMSIIEQSLIELIINSNSSNSGSASAATSSSAHTSGSQAAVVSSSSKQNAAVGSYSIEAVTGGLASFVAVAGVLLF